MAAFVLCLVILVVFDHEAIGSVSLPLLGAWNEPKPKGLPARVRHITRGQTTSQKSELTKMHCNQSTSLGIVLHRTRLCCRTKQRVVRKQQSVDEGPYIEGDCGNALCLNERKFLNRDTLRIEQRTDLEIDVNVDGVRSLFERDTVEKLQGQLVEARMLQEREQQRDQHRQMAAIMHQYYDQQQMDAKNERQSRIERMKRRMKQFEFPKRGDCRLLRPTEGDIFKSFGYKRAFGNTKSNAENSSYISYNVLNMQMPDSPVNERIALSGRIYAAKLAQGFLQV